MKRLLLTGCGSPASQNFLASLRLSPEPYYIVGTDANKYHLEWGDLQARYLAPMTSDPGYFDFLCRLIEKERIDFVHGQPDWEVAFLAANADRLPCRTFLTRSETVALAQNKYAAGIVWHEKGLRTRPPQLIEDGFDFIFAELPAWMRATRGAGARGARKVNDVTDALAWLALWRGKPEYEFMLEEYLPGREYAFASVWWQGELICSVARERIEKTTALQMGEAGVTSSYIVARTVHNPTVNEVSTQAIIALDTEPHGIFCVDLKEDNAGRPRPTEINAGRFFTTSLFYAAAGCNLPWIYTRLGLYGDLAFSHTHDDFAPPICQPYDALPAGLLWVRNMDTEPMLLREEDLRAVEVDTCK